MLSELIALGPTFEAIGVVDVFSSLIWTERYYGNGEFELYIPAGVESLNFLDVGCYLAAKESDCLMVIENIELEMDAESGDHFTISGRSSDSVLDRRIIWAQTTFTGNLQTGIKKLIDENAIAPSDSARTIPNLTFSVSTDPAVTSLVGDGQYAGQNLFASVKALCEEAGLGFKLTNPSGSLLVFSLYSGVDRSYQQETNAFVVFSPEFDNLVTSRYIRSEAALKTITRIGGEGEGSARRYTTAQAPGGAGTGLARREMFTDASSISSTVNGVTISEAVYFGQLAQKGLEDLSANTALTVFDGEVLDAQMYQYGVDFFLGDIVQTANQYGMETSSRITEYIWSVNDTEARAYPTFTTID